MNRSRRSRFLLVCLCLTIGIPPAAWASGGGVGGGNVPYRGDGRLQPNDSAYVRGKALFKGRIAPYRELRYCLRGSEEGPIAIDRRSIKAHKRAKRNELANAIVICSEPDQTLLSRLEVKDAAALIHYLDKRYRLRLE